MTALQNRTMEKHRIRHLATGAVLLLAFSTTLRFVAAEEDLRQAMAGEWAGTETLMLTGKCQFRPNPQKTTKVRWEVAVDPAGILTIQVVHPEGIDPMTGQVGEDGASPSSPGAAVAGTNR